MLTLVTYNQPKTHAGYVNSMWELQDEPFKGDVVNSYNDGPAEPGAKPLGPFYELESSSMAAALDPGEKISHVHRTFHLQGSEADLDPIFAPVERGEALVDVETVAVNIKFGMNYTSVPY